MKTNVDIIEQLGMLKVDRNVMISVEEMGNYPPERLVILATGAQGDEYGALMRAANKTHRNLKIVKGDVIILSSSIIPGNERGVQKLKDLLSRQGAKIIHYQTSDVHSSGHANRDEMAWFHRKIHPRFFVPIHGYHYMLTVHADLARSLGLPESNVFIPDNGAIIEISPNGTGKILSEKAPANKVMVDGTSVSDVQDVVIKDRQMLAEDGMFVIVAVIDGATGQLRKSPDIISRGFVYLKESQDLLRYARIIIKNTVEEITTRQSKNGIDVDNLKQTVTDTVSRFLLQKTAKRPVVIPVILSI
jgi:ribonuclease J